jgi:hypothetical protein
MKNWKSGSATGVELAVIRVRSDSLLTDTNDQMKNRKLIAICQFKLSHIMIIINSNYSTLSFFLRASSTPVTEILFQFFIIDFNFFRFFFILKTLKINS